MCAHDRHGMNLQDARETAKVARGYIDVACNFVEQSYGSSELVAFLPLYYSMLNFTKAYAAFRPSLRSQIAMQRYHGLAYLSVQQNKRNLLSEEIKIHQTGVFSLLYEAITGHPLPPVKPVWEMREFYPFVSGITAEYEMATGSPSSLAACAIMLNDDKKDPFVRARFVPLTLGKPASMYQVMPGFSLKETGENVETYESPPISQTGDAIAAARASIRPYLLYEGTVRTFGQLDITFHHTPVSAKRLLLPEEVPLFIALFHLGSAVRYKPDFMQRIMDSEYWPMVLCLRNEAIFKVLSMFWQYVRQESMHITHPP